MTLSTPLLCARVCECGSSVCGCVCVGCMCVYVCVLGACWVCACVRARVSALRACMSLGSSCALHKDTRVCTRVRVRAGVNGVYKRDCERVHAVPHARVGLNESYALRILQVMRV